MAYRNPLTVSANELMRFKANLVSIQYNGFELERYIGEIFLAANNPNEVGSFDFTLTSKCKAKLRSNIELIPMNFTAFDIQGIKQID